MGWFHGQKEESRTALFITTRTFRTSHLAFLSVYFGNFSQDSCKIARIQVEEGSLARNVRVAIESAVLDPSL